MSVEILLRVMADGGYHSGEELGNALGISRTAVWKQVKKLESFGIAVSSVKGKGYCIDGGLDLLCLESIHNDLSASAQDLISRLDIIPVVTSTNAVAMEHARDNGQSGYICTAEQQTAGRGRRGKAWQSPYGCNLYLSVTWTFVGGAAALEGLSLAVGVAVVRALNKVGVTGGQIKWPNDILVQGKKLAGILLEMSGDAAGPCQLVLGVGLNVKMPKEKAVDIDQPWIDIDGLSDARLTRSQLLAELLNEIMPLLSSFEAQGFAQYRDEFLRLDAFLGKPIYIRVGDNVVYGDGAGIDSTGAVLLDTAEGLQAFSGGEISLRSIDDPRM